VICITWSDVQLDLAVCERAPIYCDLWIYTRLCQ